MVVTALSEQSVVDYTVNVELVKQRIAIFGYRRRKNNDFVQLAHALHEGVHTRPLNHINIVILTFYLDRNSKIRLVKDLFNKMNKISKLLET